MLSKEVPDGYSAAPVGEDMFKWKATILGPKGGGL